jgi:hypothetical protein
VTARRAGDDHLGEVVLAAEQACGELHSLAERLSDHARDLAAGEHEAGPRHLEFLAQRLHGHADLLLLEAWGGTPESTRLTAHLVRRLLHSPLPRSEEEVVDPAEGSVVLPTLRELSSSAMHRLDELDRAGQRAITDRAPERASLRHHDRTDDVDTLNASS